MFRFLHAADIHLDSPLRGLETYPDAPVEQIRGAARRAFDNLVRLAMEEGVAFVLIAGDLFDGDWKDYNTGLYFMNRMGRLRAAGIPVLIVAGNHDAAGQLTRALHLPDNVTLFGSRRAETHLLPQWGVAVHGQSFAARVVSEDLSRDYPSPVPGMVNIGLLHTSLNGRAGHEPYAPCTLESLQCKGYDYWALGHVHQHEILARDPWVVFSGNLQGRHIRETGGKGCCLVTVDEGRVLGVEQRELDVLRFNVVQVAAADCADIAQLLGVVRVRLETALDAAQGRPVVLRVTVHGVTELHAQLHGQFESFAAEVQAMAAGLGEVWLERVELATEAVTAAVPDDESPLAALLRGLEGLELDAAAVDALVPDWNGLQGKLPPEIRAMVPGGEFEPLLEDVRALLAARLGGGRHEN